ncbi:MAG: GNAT family N-acetyltransferase [Bacteroidales bacterium]|nr:GNAT family N-acetyltransferase [Bacteroidales bacterium]
MQLAGKKIYLRKMEPEDLEFLYTVENNSDFWHVSETKSPYSRWELKQYIENYCYDIFTTKELRLMICDYVLQKPIGIVDLFEYHPLHNRCGVGIIVRPEHWGMGIATETLELIENYTFKTLLLNQLWCIIDENNESSIALFQKCGFVRNGILRQWKLTENGYVDVGVWQHTKN